MGIKKLCGFIFTTYSSDHPPYHVHVKYGNREIGRFDIENKKPLGKKKSRISGKLKKALKELGYLK